MNPEIFKQDATDLTSSGGGSDFLSRQKSLFDKLDAAEQASSCRRTITETPESMSHRHHVFDSSTHNKHKKRAETKRFRGQESIFVKPDPPSPWQGKRIPDHRKNPHKWTKYSLGDVSPDDMSDKTNTSTALSFLNELQKRKELSKRSSEKMEEDSKNVTSQVVFKKPTKLKCPQEENPESSTFRGSKRIMPEYVVGQGKGTNKRNSQTQNKKDKSAKSELALDHLLEFDEELDSD
ncbi:hypothetical protein B566_EDAN006822 [Ephemera danica]|nr:hypothetical protein B566_EDAN006822 [Ephemera danica]